MAQVYDKGSSPDEDILGRECPVYFFFFKGRAEQEYQDFMMSLT